MAHFNIIEKIFFTGKSRLERIYRKKSSKPYSLVKRSGRFFLIDWNNWVDYKIAKCQYELDQIDFFASKINENDMTVFIDIGAHSGYYSILFSGIKSLDTMHCFEPDPENRAQLHANLFLNGLSHRIKVHTFAVSDQEETVFIDDPDEGNRGRRKICSVGEVPVKAKALDQVLDIKLQTIAIKVDVEGHELRVLKGMSGLLQHNRCILQVESFPENKLAVNENLKSLGYKYIKSIADDHYFLK